MPSGRDCGAAVSCVLYSRAEAANGDASMRTLSVAILTIILIGCDQLNPQAQQKAIPAPITPKLKVRPSCGS